MLNLPETAEVDCAPVVGEILSGRPFAAPQESRRFQRQESQRVRVCPPSISRRAP
jgi:hypothetical protein